MKSLVLKDLFNIGHNAKSMLWEAEDLKLLKPQEV